MHVLKVASVTGKLDEGYGCRMNGAQRGYKTGVAGLMINIMHRLLLIKFGIIFECAVFSERIRSAAAVVIDCH